MNCINNVLPSKLLTSVIQTLGEISLENKYTEHSGRYGLEIFDTDVLSYLSNNLMKLVSNQLKIKKKLLLYKVWACIDEPNFEIPYHKDDIYKAVSCIIYLNDNFEGTTYLNDDITPTTVKPEKNKLIYFLSNQVIHCVRKKPFKRYTIQFYYGYESDNNS